MTRNTEFGFLYGKSHKFFILYNANNSKYPPFPLHSYEEYSSDNLSDKECIEEFRVEKNDLPV